MIYVQYFFIFIVGLRDHGYFSCMLSHTSRISLAFREFQENPAPKLGLLTKQAGLAIKSAAKFLKGSYVDGFSALLKGNYSRRQAALIIAGNVPTILGALLITVPEVLFPLPAHQAFYYFGTSLGGNASSFIPIILGAVSSTLGLRIPLG